MGQDEVLKILERNKGWMITGEIMAELGGVNRSSVNRALRNLYKNGNVMKKEIPTRKGRMSYLWKAKD